MDLSKAKWHCSCGYVTVSDEAKYEHIHNSADPVGHSDWIRGYWDGNKFIVVDAHGGI